MSAPSHFCDVNAASAFGAKPISASAPSASPAAPATTARDRNRVSINDDIPTPFLILVFTLSCANSGGRYAICATCQCQQRLRKFYECVTPLDPGNCHFVTAPSPHGFQ